jgi:transketolase
MEFVGIKDSFGGSGEPDELMEKFGITHKEIVASALQVIKRKKEFAQSYRKVIDVANL